MKPLFFHAVAGHPRVAPALMEQARATLRPFQQFLRQAVHTARSRQVRYRLPWERVRDPLLVHLEPLDTALRVPRRPPGMRLTPWPSDVEPDTTKPAFLVGRSTLVTIESARRAPDGLLVQTTPPLHPGDDLVWCEQRCTAEPEGLAAPPRTVATLDGRTLELRGAPTPAGEHDWHLCTEGRLESERLLVDGEVCEVQRPHEGPRRLIDGSGRTFEASGLRLNIDALPAEGPMRGDDGVRYRWSHDDGRRHRGIWVRLLPPEDTEADEFLDPRAAFCEGDVREVWTEPRRRQDATIAVWRVDADRYQLLLERLPPEGSMLHLPVDVRNLELQRRALHQLAEAPLPHHQGLLRLCEDPEHVRWPAVSAVSIGDHGWRSLTDTTLSGTAEQRRFVEKALGSPDLALLEGPPGSGKTTAICELVQQLLEQGKRVLLCASTHVALDNVLERLLHTTSPVDAVRIGRLEHVDDSVQRTQLDVRVEALVERWSQIPSMRAYGSELTAMAERAIVMAANLTCGTTMGIVNHPLFRGQGGERSRWEQPISTLPHWDVLIVDEASKTLIQEFLVPALMASKWIIVGDVRQLPPFTDRAAIVANLRELVDRDGQPTFPRE
ncbi:MAG: AAA family ATPase, partial [Myxococcales bacterium]|nr:AAA family ATPase [Myxococcales bacterium]